MARSRPPRSAGSHRSPDESPPSGGPPGFLLGGHGAGSTGAPRRYRNRGPPSLRRSATPTSPAPSRSVGSREFQGRPGARAAVQDEAVPRVRADPCTFYRRVSLNSVNFLLSALGALCCSSAEAVLRHGVRQLWSLRHAVCVCPRVAVMLSRSQEVRVLETLSGIMPERVFCLEHLAAAARVPSRHISDLAQFIRALKMMGDCETRSSGFCDAQQHETRTLLVWGRGGRWSSRVSPNA